MRKQLHELIETLGARDLDKVTTFAEFVKARRAARGFSSREGASESASLESDPVASPTPLSPPAASNPEPSSEPGPPASDDEEATPSSRKRPAAR